MRMLLSEIGECTGGRLAGRDVAVSSFSIDTRSLNSGDLYIAIKGQNFDGNEFVGAAEEAGAVAAVLHEGIAATVPHVVVPDTRLALGQMAGAWRNKARIAVVGVTGSNGKTTVKEMVTAILAVDGEVLSTRGNLNNDIGVPLTLLRLRDEHRYAVIEMGANHVGEIDYTSRLANADVAIITNAGAAHIEGFGSLDGVARAKGEIVQTLKATGTAILNRDDRYFDYWQSVAGGGRVVSFGFHDRADVTAKDIKSTIVDGRFATTFQLVMPEGTVPCRLQLAGRHNVANALAAAAAALALGIGPEQIVAGLQNLQPVTGRMQPLLGRKGNIVIDDTYNANSSSLKAALDVLATLGTEAWLVIGAFAELGPDSAKMHEDMGEMIKSSGVVRLLAVGSDAKNTVARFGKGASFFESQDELIATILQELKGNETILIKGSRMRRMENVVAALVENFRM